MIWIYDKKAITISKWKVEEPNTIADNGQFSSSHFFPGVIG